MLVAVTLVAAWLGTVMYRARSQAEAIKELGARVVIWDYQIPDGDIAKWDPSASQPGPAWLQSDGPTLFSKVRGVILVSPKANAAIDHLAALPRLLILNLSGSDVDDRGLDRVAQLGELQSLNLDWTPVTDAGLAKLTVLRNLEALWLNDTNVTNTGLKSLAQLPKLRRLYVEGTAVDEAGAKQLRTALPKCEVWWGPPSSPQDSPVTSEQR